MVEAWYNGQSKPIGAAVIYGCVPLKCGSNYCDSGSWPCEYNSAVSQNVMGFFELGENTSSGLLKYEKDGLA